MDGFFFKTGSIPKIFVNVYNCQARIMILRGDEYVDVTEEIPNGQELAEEAVKVFGGAINISGWYPPTQEIVETLKKKICVY